MLIQSQLSCNLPLILICPGYAIFACFFRTIRGARIPRIDAEQSRKMRENSGNSIQLLPVLLPALDDVQATCNHSVNRAVVMITPSRIIGLRWKRDSQLVAAANRPVGNWRKFSLRGPAPRNRAKSRLLLFGFPPGLHGGAADVAVPGRPLTGDKNREVTH
jgi:hypothetical protein